MILNILLSLVIIIAIGFSLLVLGGVIYFAIEERMPPTEAERAKAATMREKFKTEMQDGDIKVDDKGALFSYHHMWTKKELRELIKEEIEKARLKELKGET
jgi:hypothetical protein